MSHHKPLITGLGELLWDVFPEYRRAGGAPANVAYHARQLGNHGIPLSRVGSDTEGHELIDFLASRGLDTSHIQQDDRFPTGAVRVTMQDGEASYTIDEGAAWDHLALTDDWRDLAGRTDAVCFGSLAQRSPDSRNAILDYLSLVPAQGMKVFDVNLREPWYDRDILEASLDMADVVKLNRDEWKRLGEIFGTNDLKNWLLDEKGVSLICLTKGAEGAELISVESHHAEPAWPIDVSSGDSVGVGDAFTAALTHHLLRTSPLDIAIRSTARYAAHVAACKGAMPGLPEEVLRAVTDQHSTG